VIFNKKYKLEQKCGIKNQTDAPLAMSSIVLEDEGTVLAFMEVTLLGFSSGEGTSSEANMKVIGDGLQFCVFDLLVFLKKQKFIVFHLFGI
jgi:hypothetical protein